MHAVYPDLWLLEFDRCREGELPIRWSWLQDLPLPLFTLLIWVVRLEIRASQGAMERLYHLTCKPCYQRWGLRTSQTGLPTGLVEGRGLAQAQWRSQQGRGLQGLQLQLLLVQMESLLYLWLLEGSVHLLQGGRVELLSLLLLCLDNRGYLRVCGDQHLLSNMSAPKVALGAVQQVRRSLRLWECNDLLADYGAHAACMLFSPVYVQL
jgi:hypothetical protein